MLLMVEKSIRGIICHAIHRCVKANNKYMKDYKGLQIFVTVMFFFKKYMFLYQFFMLNPKSNNDIHLFPSRLGFSRLRCPLFDLK